MKILQTLTILSILLGTNVFATIKEHSMNPLLNYKELPDFNKIKPQHFEPAIDELLKSYKATLDNITKESNPTWENTLYKIDEEGEKFDFAMHVIRHINMVNNVEDVRKSYDKILPGISNFFTDLGQNKDLYAIYKKLRESREYETYNEAQKIIIKHALRDFKNAGVDLSDDKKGRLKEINSKLNDLGNKFGNNVVDASQAWTFHITDDNKVLLEGLPAHTIALASTKAKEQKKDGWVLTLDQPCYMAVMYYAKDRGLREKFYRAYNTRASKEAEAKQFDNSTIIDEMLALRQEKARIIGYKNYAEYSLSAKMAQDTGEVMKFLEDLAHRSKAQGKKELAVLEKFAKEQDGIKDFSAWDSGYYSTLYKKIHYDFSEEDLRPYFPEDKVFQGLFKLASRLFGISIEEVQNFSKWNKSVRLFEIRDESGNLRGKFYADLFARDFKQGGAWVLGLTSRMKYKDGSIQTPVAFLAGNFTPSSDDKPALLSHSEIETLFHEFGHMLHHTLTLVDYPGVAGTNVAWDAVELPSQFMENWSYEWEVIKDISGHYKTGQPLPKAEFDKLISAKNYNSALTMLRQLEFSLFDFRLHMHEGKDAKRTVQQILDDVRNEISVLKTPVYNRFQNGFTHIFDGSFGGYSAGYYSYKWAEVLSSDAFGMFEEKGIWNRDVGLSFLHNILEKGGSEEPMDLFIKFRGRKPKIDALLKLNGIEG